MSVRFAGSMICKWTDQKYAVLCITVPDLKMEQITTPNQPELDERGQSSSTGIHETVAGTDHEDR